MFNANGLVAFSSQCVWLAVGIAAFFKVVLRLVFNLNPNHASFKLASALH